jgi:hypothetical protein
MLWVRVGQENEVAIMKGLHVLFVLLTSLSFAGSDGCVEVGVVDEGFHVADDGVELYPCKLPAALLADETVDDAAALPEALDRWHGWTSQDGIDRVAVVEAEATETPRVLVSFGYVPAPDWGETFISGDVDDPVGIAYVDYAEDGEILGAEIVISSDVAYDHETVVDVLSHEIGHAVFGLADDPGPPTTVELRSILSSPLDPLGELTRHDFELILPYLPGS